MEAGDSLEMVSVGGLEGSFLEWALCPSHSFSPPLPFSVFIIFSLDSRPIEYGI